MSHEIQSPVVDPERRDHLLEHAYDGIQEYDNPLPRWWVAIFWATIVFSLLYVVYFHFGPGLLAHEQYDAEMVAFYDAQASKLLAMGSIDEKMLAGLTQDPSMVNTGKKIFQSRCATCHGMFGEGNIGPNLTDNYWLHGAQLEDIYHTITKGVPEKGMLAWERQLRPAQILAVTSFVGTLTGTDPPNQKAPQGEEAIRKPPAEVGDAPAEPPADTAAADGGTGGTESAT